MQAFILAATFAVLLSSLVSGQNLINRLACTSLEPTSDTGQLVFTDAESDARTYFPLPPGLRPGNLIAMDRNGDVWLDDVDSILLRKFSAMTGQVVAIVTPIARATYLITDTQANLVVGCAEATPSPQASAYVQRYSSAGSFIDGVNLRNLFPSGTFTVLSTAQVFGGANGGVMRIIITRSGALWLALPSARNQPIIKLNPNLTLAAYYGLYRPCVMLPDNDEGVWIAHISALVSSLSGPLMPGANMAGWLHLSGGGAILQTSNDLNALGTGVPSYGHARYDGRHYQFPTPGAIVAPAQLWVHDPSNPPVPWYAWDQRVPIPALGMWGAFSMGFHLDGAQRIWVMQNSQPGLYGPVAINAWRRIPIEPPYTNVQTYEVGETFRQINQYPNTFFWTSFIGNPSLYEYVFYTDPYGDLDGDGVSNEVELSTFSNALLPYGYSSAVTATATPPNLGSTFTVTYTIPEDAGLAYAAPFALVPANYSLGGGWFLPASLQDPLLQLSITPGALGFAGIIGILDAQGMASASVQLPSLPSLSGLSFLSFLVTVDPNLPTPLKTVSAPFSYVLQ